jgi:trimeric autotransporter adhesin
MDAISETILALKPVTFHYKRELDPKRVPQFGLVAEQVEKVNADLVLRDAEGKAYTVRYDAVSAMLLNEFIKEHRKVQEQQATITQLKSAVGKQNKTIAEQQKGITALRADLAEQAAQIQKVSERLELTRPAPRMVDNNR